MYLKRMNTIPSEFVILYFSFYLVPSPFNPIKLF